MLDQRVWKNSRCRNFTPNVFAMGSGAFTSLLLLLLAACAGTGTPHPAARPEGTARIGPHRRFENLAPGVYLAVDALLPPDHVFAAKEGLRLTFGSDEVIAVWPGAAHAPDNLVVWFPQKAVLF